MIPMTPAPPDLLRRQSCAHQPVSRWSREQIRAARQVELAPLLLKRGLALRETGGGNFEPDNYKGLIIKASYWRWPERNLAGNTIDFHVKVLGLSFSDAMSEILQ